MLHKSCESGHHYLFGPENILSLTIEYVLLVVVFHRCQMSGQGSTLPILVWVFILWKDIWLCQLLFLCKLRWSHIVWYTDWYSYLNPALHFLDNSHLNLVYNLFIIVELCLLVFCQEFLQLHHKECWPVISFSHDVFVLFSYELKNGPESWCFSQEFVKD